MSSYLTCLTAHTQNDGRNLLAYLLLVLLVAALPAAAVVCLLLSLVGLLWAGAATVAFVACGARDRLASLLLTGRAVLADGLRGAADAIDPRTPTTAAVAPATDAEGDDDEQGGDEPRPLACTCPPAGTAIVALTCTDCGRAYDNCHNCGAPFGEYPPTAAYGVPAGLPSESQDESGPFGTDTLSGAPAIAYESLAHAAPPVEAAPLPLRQSYPLPMPSANQLTDEAPAVPVAEVIAHTADATDATGTDGTASTDGSDDEPARLRAALANHGSIRAAARALGIGESTLRGRLKRHGIEAPANGKRGRQTRQTAEVAEATEAAA